MKEASLIDPNLKTNEVRQVQEENLKTKQKQKQKKIEKTRRKIKKNKIKKR